MAYGFHAPIMWFTGGGNSDDLSNRLREGVFTSLYLDMSWIGSSRQWKWSERRSTRFSLGNMAKRLPFEKCPHIQEYVCSNFDSPYTREEKAFPAEFIR